MTYKFLARGAVGRFSDVTWPTPSAHGPGAWIEAGGPLRDCAEGVHACRREHLLDWIDDELWEIELDGEIVERDGMVIAERGRLVRFVAAWDAETAQAFADACARRARAHARNALLQSGLSDDARRVVEEAALRDLALETDGAAAEIVGFAADAASLAAGHRPEAWRSSGGLPAVAQSPGATAANLAFVVAHVAGRERAAAQGDDAYDAAFAAERAWQLAWLTDRLALA